MKNYLEELKDLLVSLEGTGAPGRIGNAGAIVKNLLSS